MKKVKAKSKSKRKIEYPTHNLGCNICLNYHDGNMTCFVCVRNYSSAITRQYYGGILTFADDDVLEMFASVLTNMKIDYENVFPENLIKMNNKLSCPFHTRLNDCVELAEFDVYEG